MSEQGGESTPPTEMSTTTTTKRKRKRPRGKTGRLDAAQRGALLVGPSDDGRYTLTCLFCTSRPMYFEDASKVRFDNFYTRHVKTKHKAELRKVTRFIKENRKRIGFCVEDIVSFWEKTQESKRLESIRQFTHKSDFNYYVKKDTMVVAEMFGFKRDVERGRRTIVPARDREEPYVIRASSLKRFEFCAELLEGSSSYQEIARMMKCVSKREFQRVEFKGINRETLSVTSAQIGMICLQTIAQLLTRTYGFSIALDGSRWKRAKHIGIRFRVYFGEGIHSIFGGHLKISPTPSDLSATAHVFNSLVLLMDAMLPKWREKLVGITTDGASDMLGIYNGLQTRFRSVVSNTLICVWCGCHQLDVELSHRYEDEKFQVDGQPWTQTLDEFVTQLRKRTVDFKKECPSRANTRWYTIMRTTSWIGNRFNIIRQQHQEKRFSNFPSDQWWVILFVVKHFATTCYKAMKKMQGRRILISQQIRILAELKDELRACINSQEDTTSFVHVPLGTRFRQRFCEGTFEGKVIGNTTKAGVIWNEVKYSDGALGVLEDIDIRGMINGESDQDNSTTVASIKKFCRSTSALGSSRTLFGRLTRKKKVHCTQISDWLFGETVAGLYHRIASQNTCGRDQIAPCVLPVDIVENEEEASKFFAEHLQRFPEALGASVSDEFGMFTAIKDEYPDAWKQIVESSGCGMAPFSDAWGAAALCPYGNLRMVCGTLATVFPHTGGVEGDFSTRKSVVHGREKLTHFRQQSDMHCKTFPLFKGLGLVFPPKGSK